MARCMNGREQLVWLPRSGRRRPTAVGREASLDPPLHHCSSTIEISQDPYSGKPSFAIACIGSSPGIQSISEARRQYSPGRIIGIARIVCMSNRSRSTLMSSAHSPATAVPSTGTSVGSRHKSGGRSAGSTIMPTRRRNAPTKSASRLGKLNFSTSFRPSSSRIKSDMTRSWCSRTSSSNSAHTPARLMCAAMSTEESSAILTSS